MWVTIRHCRNAVEATTLINQLRRIRTNDRPLRRRNAPGGVVRIQELRGEESFDIAAPCITTRIKPFTPNDSP